MSSASVPDLAACSVTDLRGETIPMGTLWRSAPVILVFIRHFGCVMCRRQVAEFRESVLPDCRIPIAIIGNGQRIHAKWFQIDLEIPEVEVYVDESLRAFRAAGMRRSVLSVVNPITLVHAIRAHRGGHRQVGVQGDNFQQGGVVWVRPPGEVMWESHSRIAGKDPDWAALRERMETWNATT